MTKHLGPIIVWIIVAGIALYVVRHLPDLLGGTWYIRQSVDEQQLLDSIETFFK